MPFRYSGSKKRLIKHLPPPPPGTRIIVEPFAGSAAYGLHYRPEKLFLAEANTDVANLWRWLIHEATISEIDHLEAVLNVLRVSGKKFDIRDLNLPKPKETLTRLNSASVMVGQLSSWQFYPQHSINFNSIRNALPYIQQSVRLVSDSFVDLMVGGKDSLLFVDPPYLGSSGNYINKSDKTSHDSSFSARDVEAQLLAFQWPYLLTYGEGAKETFPSLQWQELCKMKVPDIRNGGSKERTEWLSRKGL